MITVVTEGPFHERLLTLLLSDLADACEVRVIEGGSRDGARPLARQIMILQRHAVVYAIDADTVDRDCASEQQRTLEWYFGLPANEQFARVVQFVPTIEAIFFERPRILERLLGRKLEPAVRVAGEIAPRAVLDRILPEVGGENLMRRIDELTGDELRELRSHPTIATIREFVEANAEPTLLRRSA
jgi:hypothetical protein